MGDGPFLKSFNLFSTSGSPFFAFFGVGPATGYARSLNCSTSGVGKRRFVDMERFCRRGSGKIECGEMSARRRRQQLYLPSCLRSSFSHPNSTSARLRFLDIARTSAPTSAVQSPVTTLLTVPQGSSTSYRCSAVSIRPPVAVHNEWWTD